MRPGALARDRPLGEVGRGRVDRGAPRPRPQLGLLHDGARRPREAAAVPAVRADREPPVRGVLRAAQQRGAVPRAEPAPPAARVRESAASPRRCDASR